MFSAVWRRMTKKPSAPAHGITQSNSRKRIGDQSRIEILIER